MDDFKDIGAFIRHERVNSLKMSLRHFCQQNGWDIGNWSKIERNRRDAPEAGELARLLNIPVDSGKFQLLKDLKVTQVVGKELSDDEVLERLPVALRAARNLTEAEMDELKRKIKEN